MVAAGCRARMRARHLCHCSGLQFVRFRIGGLAEEIQNGLRSCSKMNCFYISPSFYDPNTLSRYTVYYQTRRISLLFGSWIRVVSKQRIFLGRNVSICGVDHLSKCFPLRCPPVTIVCYCLGVQESIWCMDIALLNMICIFEACAAIVIFFARNVLQFFLYNDNYSQPALFLIFNYN